MKKFLIILVVLCFVVGCGKENSVEPKGEYQTILSQTVQEYLEEGTSFDYQIVDVRTEPEYESGHLPGAINIPLDSLSTISTIEDFDTMLIVYCQSGVRSKQAALQLLDMGYTNVYDMGGIATWDYEIVK